VVLEWIIPEALEWYASARRITGADRETET
jgi:hypothetical protein